MESLKLNHCFMGLALINYSIHHKKNASSFFNINHCSLYQFTADNKFINNQLRLVFAAENNLEINRETDLN